MAAFRRISGSTEKRSEKILQLGEVAFPVLLARRLHRLELLGRFNPRTMVKRAVAFLLQSGPVTNEERWEESGGYSPSTLAIVITAFICAALSHARKTMKQRLSLRVTLIIFVRI